ncbi:hypothetical protein SEUCBS139899_005577 [Sporothrix eucalyptigena]|uniref:NAD(P)-binding protein n=1 Tax=Sporothrix eucalyptigena TaxID=1812306 RepID=A0ABP0C0Y7_9PEZI
MGSNAAHKPGALLSITENSIPDAAGKIFLITGGGSGIGLATVRLLESKHAKGIVIADYKKPSDDILGRLAKTTLFVQTDVTSWASLVNVFKTTVDTYGMIDGVYANAGLGELDHLFVNKIDAIMGELQPPNYANIEVNLKGVLSTVKLAVYWFRKLKVEGTLVMTASMSAYETPGIPIYTSSKHAVLGILRGAQLDLWDEYKIKMNVVSPGPVLTNLIDSFASRTSTKYDGLVKDYTFENQGPEHPALAAAHLLLTEKDHGRSILVHGGRFRDGEEVYDSVRDQLLGSELGIPPVSDLGWRNLFRCIFD